MALASFENIPKIIAIICLAPFIKKFGKRNLVLFGAVLCVLLVRLLSVCAAKHDYGHGAAVMRGIGEAPFYGCIFTMLADVIEYGHWKTGIRVQALIFSAFTVGQKFGGGVAGWLVGQLMEASGFTGLAVEIPSAVSMVKTFIFTAT